MVTKSNTAIEKRQGDRVDVPQQTEPQATRPPYYTPRVDVAENNEAFLFQADLPGVKPEDVDIHFENGALTLHAKAQPRQPRGQAYAWREYGVGHFYRSFSIEAPVNVDSIRAELKNGVLELYVPKAESAKARRIEIKTA